MADEIDIPARANEVESVTVDGQTATDRPIPDLIAAANHAAAAAALAGTNRNGGLRSGWNSLRPARVIPPGAAGPGGCE